MVVPTVGISPSGVRLGYGHGFYDKFLEKQKHHNNFSSFRKKKLLKIFQNQNTT